nr:ribonuclease H-like domain-containing protein [Tanacetum cinerariifolium]
MWILSSLCDSLQEQVVTTLGNAKALWDHLKDLFHDNKDNRAINLNSELRSIKIGTMTVNEYCTKIRSMADRLKNLVCDVSDKNLVMYIVNGLDTRFATLVDIIRHRETLPSFETTRTMLLLKESSFKDDTRTSSTFDGNSSSPTALVTSTSSTPKGPHTTPLLAQLPSTQPSPLLIPATPPGTPAGPTSPVLAVAVRSSAGYSRTTSITGTMTVNEYCTKIRSMTDRLKNLGCDALIQLYCWPNCLLHRPIPLLIPATHPGTPAGPTSPVLAAVVRSSAGISGLAISSFDRSGDLYPVIKPSHLPTVFVTTSSSTWHQCLGHPGDDVLRSLSTRYPAYHRGFRCLNLETNKVILSRHVTFDETQFPYKSITPSSSPSYEFLDTHPSLLLSSLASNTPNSNTTHQPAPNSSPHSTPTPNSNQAQSTSIYTPTTSYPLGPLSDIHISPPQPSPAQPNPPAQPPQDPPRTHKMVTRSQSGIVKPLKRFSLHTTSISPILKTPFVALQNSHWCQAMLDENNALIKNGTWILVPKPAGVNMIRSMWLFKHKFNANGTLSRYKARFIFILEQLGPEGVAVQDPTLYRSLAGGLQYLTFTRPDLSYVVQQICLYMHNPWEPHFATLKRILRYVRGTVDFGLQLYASATTSLVGYTDDDWAGCPSTRHSTSEYCVFLGENLLSWSSKRQHTISRSSAEAEYRGVANVVAETAWLCNLLRELHSPLSTATLVYCDNVIVVYLSANLVQHQRTKHIEIDIHFVRDMVQTRYIRVLHVPSRYQYADIFTKVLPTALFEDFRSSLSVRLPPTQTAGAY